MLYLKEKNISRTKRKEYPHKSWLIFVKIMCAAKFLCQLKFKPGGPYTPLWPFIFWLLPQKKKKKKKKMSAWMRINFLFLTMEKKLSHFKRFLLSLIRKCQYETMSGDDIFKIPWQYSYGIIIWLVGFRDQYLILPNLNT